MLFQHMSNITSVMSYFIFFLVPFAKLCVFYSSSTVQISHISSILATCGSWFALLVSVQLA